jgi:hypothetical protein
MPIGDRIDCEGVTAMEPAKNVVTGIVTSVLLLLAERRVHLLVALLIACAVIALGHGHALAGHRTPGG